MDNIILARDLQIERKHFFIEYRENERGKFVRITEDGALAAATRSSSRARACRISSATSTKSPAPPPPSRPSPSLPPNQPRRAFRAAGFHFH